MAIAMLAASPYGYGMSSADPGSDSSEHKTLVVRADPRTGRLVRNVVTRAEPRASAGSRAEIDGMVDRAARDHDVDPLLVHSMIKVESNYDPHAVSSKGAEGLMQLMPSTAHMLGVSNSFDPQQNIEGGVKYLSYLKSLYKDDRLALAAYNAGPGSVQKYKWIPPYRETQNYVNQVGKRYGDARRAAAAKATAPAPPPVMVEPAAPIDPVEETHPKLEQFVDQNGRLHLRTAQ
jgi:soluble lytic murein transglycosylase-like protein